MYDREQDGDRETGGRAAGRVLRVQHLHDGLRVATQDAHAVSTHLLSQVTRFRHPMRQPPVLSYLLHACGAADQRLRQPAEGQSTGEQ